MAGPVRKQTPRYRLADHHTVELPGKDTNRIDAKRIRPLEYPSDVWIQGHILIFQITRKRENVEWNRARKEMFLEPWQNLSLSECEVVRAQLKVQRALVFDLFRKPCRGYQFPWIIEHRITRKQKALTSPCAGHSNESRRYSGTWRSSRCRSGQCTLKRGP